MEYQKMLVGENPYFVSCVHASYPTHCHNEIELLYCIHGNITAVIENKEYKLTEGSILLVSSLAMHQITIEDDSFALVLEFGSNFLGSEFNDITTQKFSKCLITPNEECEYRNRLEKPIKRIYKEFSNPKKGTHWAIRGFLLEIFAMIVRYVPMQAQNSQKLKNLDRYLKIQKVFDLVQNDYADEISLERAAACAGYDPRAFCRLFKFITNMTFHDYLNLHRINVSMRLLEHNAYSINEIGQMVGIPVAKTFSRVFRKYTEMSPSQYRNLYLKSLNIE